MSHNRDPMNPENRPGNSGVITSSSSDDGNNSSGDSDEAGDGQQRRNFRQQQGGQQNAKKPASTASAINTTYQDYSRDPPDTKSISFSLAQGNATRDPTFVVKLHMILSNSKFESIVTWLPHGRSWRIIRPKDFEEKVIPLYFRHGRYSSFMRQVNGWGFRRVTGGSDYNSYYHQVSLVGREALGNCPGVKSSFLRAHTFILLFMFFIIVVSPWSSASVWKDATTHQQKC